MRPTGTEMSQNAVGWSARLFKPKRQKKELQLLVTLFFTLDRFWVFDRVEDTDKGTTNNYSMIGNNVG